MADATALVTDDATTERIEVRWINTLAHDGGWVRVAVLDSQEALDAFLDRGRGFVELVSVKAA